MGDMPEILYNLLAKGKAVLWSSQDKQACKVGHIIYLFKCLSFRAHIHKFQHDFFRSSETSNFYVQRFLPG